MQDYRSWIEYALNTAGPIGPPRKYEKQIHLDDGTVVYKQTRRFLQRIFYLLITPFIVLGLIFIIVGFMESPLFGVGATVVTVLFLGYLLLDARDSWEYYVIETPKYIDMKQGGQEYRWYFAEPARVEIDDSQRFPGFTLTFADRSRMKIRTKHVQTPRAIRVIAVILVSQANPYEVNMLISRIEFVARMVFSEDFKQYLRWVNAQANSRGSATIQ